MTNLKAVYASKASNVGMVQAKTKYAVLRACTRSNLDFYLIALPDGRQIYVTLGDGVLGTFKAVGVSH